MVQYSPPGSTCHAVQDMSFSLSVTNMDIPQNWFFDIVGFFQNLTIEGVIALETGKDQQHLHCNAATKGRFCIVDSQLEKVKTNVKKALRTDRHLLDPNGTNRVLVSFKPFKPPTQTWDFMVGYCMKDTGKSTFALWRKCQNPEEMVKNFIKYHAESIPMHGDPDRKLIQKNDLFKKVNFFIRTEVRPVLPSLARALAWYVQRGDACPHSHWVVPNAGAQMKRSVAEAEFRLSILDKDEIMQLPIKEI